MKEENKSFSVKKFLLLQGAVMLYTCTDIAAKFASGYEFLSADFILCYGAEIAILGLYTPARTE